MERFARSTGKIGLSGHEANGFARLNREAARPETTCMTVSGWRQPKNRLPVSCFLCLTHHPMGLRPGPLESACRLESAPDFERSHTKARGGGGRCWLPVRKKAIETQNNLAA